VPELPEVETVRRGLEACLLERRIDRVDVRETRLRYPVDTTALERRVVGKAIRAFSRRAKYLLVHLVSTDGDSSQDEEILVIHLGMSGSLLVLEPEVELAPHTHVVFELDDGRQLRFRDHRRFGLVEVLSSHRLEDDKRFSALGVEPLSDDCNATYFFERSRGLKKPVKNFLMDNQHVVGVGNIYACESLHGAGVHPNRAAGRISRERWERLTNEIKNVLSRAVEQGGTTLSDFQRPDGDAGYFQVSLSVYGREGEACERCGRDIRRRVMSGRSTFFCPGCQK